MVAIRPKERWPERVLKGFIDRWQRLDSFAHVEAVAYHLPRIGVTFMQRAPERRKHGDMPITVADAERASVERLI